MVAGVVGLYLELRSSHGKGEDPSLVAVAEESAKAAGQVAVRNLKVYALAAGLKGERTLVLKSHKLVAALEELDAFLRVWHYDAAVERRGRGCLAVFAVDQVHVKSRAGSHAL